MFDLERYHDICAICGTTQTFVREKLPIRETYNCLNCRGSLREREHARTLLSFYGRGKFASLSELVETHEFRALTIYEPGTVGAMRKYLKRVPNYLQSDYYADKDARKTANSPPHENIEELSYKDNSIDLVISSDIIEHVRSPRRAFAAAFRVLRPGGVFCFTVPLQEPLKAHTVERVDTSGVEEKCLLEAHYHGDGKGGKSLVYNDFGRDIVDKVSAAGFIAGLVKSRAPAKWAGRSYTVFGVKV